MFPELDAVVLAHDISEYDLKQGDIGAVVRWRWLLRRNLLLLMAEPLP